MAEQEPELNHRCRADERCAARTSEGSAITAKPDTLCHSCVNALQERLDELPTIRNVLRLYLVQGGSSAQTKVSSTSEPQPPFNVHVCDLIDSIDDVMDRTAGLTVDALIRQPELQFKLWRNGGWKMDYLDGVQRALDIDRIWRTADGVIGITRQWQQRLAKCPKCNTRTLGNIAGEDSVHCSSCGGVMTRNEYSALCIVTANDK